MFRTSVTSLEPLAWGEPGLSPNACKERAMTTNFRHLLILLFNLCTLEKYFKVLTQLSCICALQTQH